MADSILSACFTGHRPERFGRPDQYRKSEQKLSSLLADEVIRTIDRGCTVFYCGMARGTDLLAGETVLSLKPLYPKIRLIAVIPYPKQPYYWENQWVARYNQVLHRCDEAVTIAQNYAGGCFALRNRYMVDHSDHIIAVINPEESHGGTVQTIRYAKRQNKSIAVIPWQL
jgi:uncharacterized phage-like protein YoqJ